MDPNTILILLKVLDIASALFARIGERNTEDEVFVAKVRKIIRDQGGFPSEADFAELANAGGSLTQRLEALLATKTDPSS